MSTPSHRTHVYVGLAGESALAVGREGHPLGTGGLYRRAEGEAEWTSMTRGLPEAPQVRALLVHPANPAVVFAGTQAGVYRSENRGESWTATQSLQGDVWSLAIHPHNHHILFAGYDQGRVCRSTDGGASWQQMHTKAIVYPHITMRPQEIVKRVIGIAIDANNPDDVYGAVEVGGLIASRDGGEHWESLTDGHYTRLGPVDLHGVQVNPTAPGLVYIITQLAMFRSRQRGRNWELVPIEEMFDGGAYCRGLTIAPDNPRTMYLAAGAGGGSAPPGTTEAGVLLRSQDAGETWSRVALGEVAPSRMFQMAIDPAAPSHLYCATRDGQVYSSADGGTQWTKSQIPGEMSRGRHVYPLACG
ncbi:MAG: WD40/YVTN/BNR-like repeat-containing protein [Candidatus Tectimicrobiota bacterium]